MSTRRRRSDGTQLTLLPPPTGQLGASAVYRQAFGAEPDAWQIALAATEWPRILVAPTGSGKTAAVTLGWAAHRLNRRPETPRRLVWCLPMRTLVEQTAEKVKEWFGRLAEIDDANRLPRPKEVHVLMGGTASADWLEAPERPAVVVGTQDMLLSRALMRGYASSRALWPMEFALLHEDAQWVFDEVQLMGAGRATSAQLEAFRQHETARAAKAGVRRRQPSRSLWLSATLDPSWLATVDHPAPPPTSVVTVDPVATGDARLARLARATKKLHRSPVAPASPKKTDLGAYAGALADEVIQKHRPGRMTIAIVNRVDRAQALYGMLEKQIAKLGQSPPTLALVHSRFRLADRQREMEKVTEDTNKAGQIVVATQAIEAGVDISAAVLFTEIAPWSSMIQRFGRANRYAELPDGANVHWIDLLDAVVSDKDGEKLALPYTVEQLRSARERMEGLTDVASVHLPAPDPPEPPRRVIRRKDLDDLFDTDPDLTGFDVDISPYVRDADDTDIRIFWRDLSAVGDEPPRPIRKEICAVSIGSAREWIKNVRKLDGIRVFQRDPQWRRKDGGSGDAPPGWMAFLDQPWPGLMLLADRTAGGYMEHIGFTADPKHVPNPVADLDSSTSPASTETEGHGDDQLSQIDVIVSLTDHTQHVVAEANALCNALDIDPELETLVTRAARWHDLGKAHEVFQDTMRRGLGDRDVPDALLAKTVGRHRHSRRYFRHELASALAFLASDGWSRDADLIAYLIAAHHGKVRMNLRALPRERGPGDERAGAFARGIWEGDELPPFDMKGGEHWPGGPLHLSIIELGWHETTHESWTERTQELLARFGPFRLAWMETLLRLADWRASQKEREGSYHAR